MNMISFLNTSDRTAWTQTGPEKPFGFSGPVPCLCNTNIPAIDYFLIRPWQVLSRIMGTVKNYAQKSLQAPAE